ncbi:hypothetical protein MGH68_01460 [Erysipelothrix sp. D19-032]
MTNLELIDHQNGKELSLFHYLNKTRTNMGARALKQELMQPMVSKTTIYKRHAQIETLIQDYLLNDKLVASLKEVYDIHRVVARMATGKHNAQDLVRPKKTLGVFRTIQRDIEGFDEFQFISELDPLEAILEMLDNTILDDAPVQLKEGRTFKTGIHDTLDELLEISKNGKQWLVTYEAKQREKTGIKNLKVGYNRAFGYFIEVSKGQVDNVRDDFGYIEKTNINQCRTLYQ